MADCADTINALIDAVEAIEHELGITPSSVYSTVSARLDILESRVGDGYGGNNSINNTTINFGTVFATSRSVQTITFAGVKVGQNVVINPRLALPSTIQIDYCRVSAINTIEIAVYNRSGAGVAVNQAFDITVITSS